MAKNKYGSLSGFEIAGPDRKFYFARAFIRDNQVVVSADSGIYRIIPWPLGMAGVNAPADIDLYNLEGFPASPFITDDWPGITDSERFFKK